MPLCQVPPPAEIYTLSLHDALPICLAAQVKAARGKGIVFVTGLETGSFGDLVDAWMRETGGRHVTYEPFAFEALREGDRKSTRLNSSHTVISYAVFCLKKKIR